MKKTSSRKLILNIIVMVAFFISLQGMIADLFDVNRRDNFFKLISSLITLISGFTLYIYNNSNTIFFLINKISTYFSFKTVNWEMSYSTNHLTISDIQIIKEELCKILKNEEVQIIKNVEKEESNIIKTKNHKRIEADFVLRWDPDTDNKQSFTIIFKSQTSHRDVRQQWDFYRKVLEEIFKIVKQESNYSKERYERRSYYTVSLNMNKNPFYLLTIKTYDKPQNIKFDLSFSVDGVKFRSTNQNIVITTEDITKVDTVLKDYVMLGKVS